MTKRVPEDAHVIDISAMIQAQLDYEDRIIAAVRQAILAAGGNPDTAYPISVGSDDDVIYPEGDMTISVTFNYKDWGK